MRIVIKDGAQEAAAYCAALLTEAIRLHPAITLGLATGGTMEPVYATLRSEHAAGRLSFAACRTFNLDEYVGLPSSHPQSYRHYMQTHLFDHIDIPPGATYLPDGNAADPRAAARDYDRLIALKGPIGLQLLGLGTNGHIGFNEPSSSLTSRSRVKTLTRDTVQANSRFFGETEAQPLLAITMGIGTIMDAQRIVLLATGATKAQAVAAMVEGPVSARCPASMLQMHADATVIVDAAAATNLEDRDYYVWVEEQRARMETDAPHPQTGA
ncbi:Glucosamine-6-phosphate deaminase 1 [Marinibacterium anthonyi]|nr:Glucosamine-6-phosphate deaminase 1 [Marinibacterium anthonyi]